MTKKYKDVIPITFIQLASAKVDRSDCLFSGIWKIFITPTEIVIHKTTPELPDLANIYDKFTLGPRQQDY